MHPGRRALFLAVAGVLALTTALGLLEAGLRRQAANVPLVESKTLPEEWAQRHVKIDGTVLAYWWHGHLHVFNRDEMRTVGLYPPKRDDRFRILAVGDSLTYGVGVAQDETYAHLLDERLGPEVEVLNLGVCGDQSEDIAETVRQQFEKAECIHLRGLPEALLPQGAARPSRPCHRYDLAPDLIVYGMCLNDFLPSGIGESTRGEGWEVPVPGKRWLMEHTLMGPFLAERYHVALVKLGLRVDFWEEVLAGGAEYRTRFAADMRRMNEVVTRNGLPPVVGMVLDQNPGQGAELVAAAEAAMREAGLTVVPAEYTERHAGRTLRVSRWEGHPNQEAHRIFADELVGVLREHPAILAHAASATAAQRVDALASVE